MRPRAGTWPSLLRVNRTSVLYVLTVLSLLLIFLVFHGLIMVGPTDQSTSDPAYTHISSEATIGAQVSTSKDGILWTSKVDRLPRKAWSPTVNGWAVSLLEHAKAYFATVYADDASYLSPDRIKLAEAAERCSRVLIDQRPGHERIRFSSRHSLCQEAFSSYQGLQPARQPHQLPPLLIKDLAINTGYCSVMSDYVWQSLIPQLPEPLQQALRALRDRQQSLVNGSSTQKFLVWSLSGGLGNRFQSLSSTLVAAMLSGRAILVKDWFTQLPPNSKSAKPLIYPSNRTADYVLEPLQKLFNEGDDQYFQNGDDVDDIYDFMLETSAVFGQQLLRKAKLNYTRKHAPSASTNQQEQLRPANRMLLCALFPVMSLSEYKAMHYEDFTSGDDDFTAPFRDDHAKIDISARHDKKLVRWNKFACAKDIGDLDPNDGGKSNTLFFAERFVYVWTNQYFAPLFFSNPRTRNTMLQWFPTAEDRQNHTNYSPKGPYNVLTKLIVVPSSHVMRRVLAFLEGSQSDKGPLRPHLAPGRFVSLQIRAFNVNAFGQMAEAFDKCFKALQGANVVEPFFIASLHQPVRDYYSSRYGGNAVSLTPPGHEQGTGKDFRLDLDALADMFVMSLSKVLLVSPGSTFGGFVAAFADHNPIRVDYHRSADGSSLPLEEASSIVLPPMCRRALSQQPCFGSWFRYDKLWHRKGELSCELQPMPAHAHLCEV